MKKSYIRPLILLLAVPMLFAQIKSISGTIRNSITLEPLPYANLTIKGTYLFIAKSWGRGGHVPPVPPVPTSLWPNQLGSCKRRFVV